MHISWLGISAIRITTRPANEDIVVLCDPYDPREAQVKRGKLVADIVTVSVQEHPLHSATQEIRGRLEKPPFIINTPGECEVNGVVIYGVPAVNTVSLPHKKVTLYMIETEGLSLLHLGYLGQKTLTDTQLERFEHVDVLFVPVGDPASLSVHEAVAIVNQIEPRIVIPVAYQAAHIKAKLLGAEKFIKELGLEADEPVIKIKLTKKDLPAEETKLMLLMPE
ncbi:MAG: MBL fold metallo-hydrolase [Patescibacteria group bacterium]